VTRRASFVLIVLSLQPLVLLTPLTVLGGEARPVQFQKGVTFYNAKGPGAYGSPAAERTMQALRRLGVDTLTLIPFGHMKATNSPSIDYGNDPEAPDPQLIQAIKDARNLGFRVLLKPHLWVPGSWPGEISMDSEEDWKVWFQHYRRFITHYASIAEATGCEFFSVGNELRMASIRDGWPEIIQAVREVYNGKLLYAAHWDGEYLWVPWEKLDLVGINFYFPLATRPDPIFLDLLDAARRLRSHLESFAKTVGRPVVLTEVGFRPVKETAMRPWESHEENPALPLDLVAQLKAYLAIYQVFKDAEWLGGLHWWLVYSDPALGGPKGADYSFLGKPAEGIVRLWFRAP
jgi:hypothetical protein